MAELVYKELDVILFALQEVSGDNSTRILLNPWNKFLETGRRYKGYIIAEDKEITSKIK